MKSFRTTMILALVLSPIVSASACAPWPLPTPTPTAPVYAATFSADEHAALSQPGTATIRGQAFVKTRGGDVKPCAGEAITLFPGTAYVGEIFGRIERGESLTVPDPRLDTYTKKAIGDGEGRFAFTGIAAGTYYVSCYVNWEVPGAYGLSKTGGWAWAKPTVTNGATSDVVVTTQSLVDRSMGGLQATPEGLEMLVLGYVTEGARIYEKPDDKSRSIYRFTSFGDVAVLESGPEWSRVRYRDKTGWVRSNRIRLIMK